MQKIFKAGNTFEHLWKKFSELFSPKGDKTTNGDTTIITVFAWGSSKGTGPPSVVINVGRTETVSDSNSITNKH